MKYLIVGACLVFCGWRLYKCLKQSTELTCRLYMSIDALVLKSGDLVLTSDFNMLTRMFGQSPWNHVGLIYCDPYSHVLYVWEIQLPRVGYLGVLFDQEIHRATRLVPWTTYWRRYHAKKFIAIRMLNKSIDNQMMKQAIQDNWKRSFAIQYLMLAFARFFNPLIKPFRQMPRKLRHNRYCAELVADTLTQVGVLDQVDDDHHILPVDFSEHAKFNVSATSKLTFRSNYHYGPEILIVSSE